MLSNGVREISATGRKTPGPGRPNMSLMRQPTPVKRYALARSSTSGRARQEEGVKRLRLVRMEEIAELDRDRERPERTRPS
jgi:hypothetical protein